MLISQSVYNQIYIRVHKIYCQTIVYIHLTFSIKCLYLSTVNLFLFSAKEILYIIQDIGILLVSMFISMPLSNCRCCFSDWKNAPNNSIECYGVDIYKYNAGLFGYNESICLFYKAFDSLVLIYVDLQCIMFQNPFNFNNCFHLCIIMYVYICVNIFIFNMDLNLTAFTIAALIFVHLIDIFSRN